jgi:ABC-type transport system substrate-binding protein/DNA-binding SARP family transcriptional activator
MAADTAAGQTASVEFGILGPLEVCRSGRAVPLGGPRQRAVLALLLLEANRVVSMDRLAEDLWGGHPPEGWATTLQIYVVHLRRALEPGRPKGAAASVLVTKGRGYLLRVDPGQLDAARFQDGFAAGRAALEAGRPAEAAGTLRAALELWRSPVLADLADYAFTRPEAARLEELRLAALEARIDADLALGRHDALTAELEHLAGEHPLRERLHGQLMLALYRCGRQAEALAAYRRVHGLLAEELGIDPGEPLQRLHASVLAHDPALDWRPGSQTLISAEDDRAGAGTPVTSPRPGRPRRWPAGGSRELVWARRRARRLLAIGSALAVAAAVSIVALARPWAGGSADLPGNSVGLIDAAGRRVGAAVAVGSPDSLAFGAGSVWAVGRTDGTVSRINPATHAVVQQIPVGTDPAAVTVTGGGDVWVANSGDGTVSRINAAAGRVVDTVQVGNIPDAIASGPSGIWVANQGDATVDQIDPGTGEVTRRGIPVGGLPDGIAVGPDAVWVANGEDGTVTRIDPATGQPSGPVPVGSGPKGIAITAAAVWVANSLDLTVSRLDPATGKVTDVIGVGDGPGAIAAAADGVWVSDEFSATLHRIDPDTNRVSRVISVGSTPRGIAAAGPGIWVAARPFAAAGHRGGTLTEVSKYLPGPDPVQAYGSPGMPALATVYDGLVAFRKTDGALGATLVPDLAAMLPRPADGGTTYTFTLRRGIRYSNGTPVRASDFRRGIQRELSFGEVPDYYEGILGARACHRNPRRCDLHAGIVTNDAAGTVTFHLDQADPDFLYKLALVLAAPAPPGAPGHLVDRAPFLPGTGPYMISQYRPNASLTLVRNPRFRQWSYAAQPAGYPNVIRFERMTDPGQQQSAVAAGRADLVDISLNGQPSRPLAVRYPTRIHSSLKLGTSFLFLNTRQPPFTSLKARQALNYAIDRTRIIQLFGYGSTQAAPACQILPAGSPSYQPYCPYTTGAKDGAWHGPDLATAVRLAHESGTTHVPVTVWKIRGQPVGAYLVHVLRQLGYRATVRNVSEGQFFATASNSSRKVQIGLSGWGADFPTASNFFRPMLSCRAFNQNPASTGNLAEFCDPHADELADEAQAAQQTDPAAARKLWASVDRIVTDQAPWVPLLTQAATVFVSARVGNCLVSPYYYGPLFDQMWVR